ncbi:MAG: hypothetical protein O3A10_09865 [Chloroflexi bacterium]|nr:hypothetical protein [Chloroflexota bacterium]MQC83234.1 hypothetical protein [Chloroflexota bacterium]
MAAKATTGEELFWELAAPHLASAEADEGTMMGSRCLRVGGQFTGMIHVKTGELILKLPRTRVDELVASGRTEAFAPNGRVFKEWTLVPRGDRRSWKKLIDEAVQFAQGSSTPS